MTADSIPGKFRVRRGDFRVVLICESCDGDVIYGYTKVSTGGVLCVLCSVDVSKELARDIVRQRLAQADGRPVSLTPLTTAATAPAPADAASSSHTQSFALADIDEEEPVKTG